MNEAASAAAVPAAAAVCQRVPQVPTICRVSTAALTGNNQIAAVRAPTV